MDLVFFSENKSSLRVSKENFQLDESATKFEFRAKSVDGVDFSFVAGGGKQKMSL